MAYLLVFLFALVTTMLAPVQPQTSKQTDIVYGSLASQGQFPYQVFLEIQTANGVLNCGGCLISDQWILSAAHCFVGGTLFRATMGTIYSSDVPNDYRIKMINTEFYVHEKYNQGALTANDLAVAKLPQKVPFNNRIAPIRVATGPQNYYGEMAVASGWGKTSDNSGVSPQLRYTSLKVMLNQECMLLYPARILPSTLCAISPSLGSTCRGDSGGPLVSQRDGKLIGLSSFGKMSCQYGEPQAFARVSSFVDWIQNKTGLTL